jgi:hypothetical protein
LFVINPRGLGSSGKGLGLGCIPFGLKFESLWVQTIPWGQPLGKARVLPDLCGAGALHGFGVYLTWVGKRSDSTLEGFLVIKKNKI